MSGRDKFITVSLFALEERMVRELAERDSVTPEDFIRNLVNAHLRLQVGL